jgi:5'-nucleotidase / UDP-sugar diphosphatase
VAAVQAESEALRREGADFVVAVVHADRKQDYELFSPSAIDLILSGHDHDLFVNFDGRAAMVESSYDAHYVSIIDVAIDVSTRADKRETQWWPQIRIIDTANVEADADVAAAVAGFEAELTRELDVPLGTTASSSTAAAAPYAPAKRRSAISSPMPCASPATPTRRS